MQIEGIELTDIHKDEYVTYSSKKSGGERGLLSSWNDRFVFVRYNDDCNSQATKPDDLYWGDREDEFRRKQSIINSMRFNDLIKPIDITNYSISGTFYNISITGIKEFRIEGYYDVSTKIFIINKKEEPKLEEIKRELKINSILK